MDPKNTGVHNAATALRPLIGITCRTRVIASKAQGLDSSTAFEGQKTCVDCIVRAGATPVLLPSVENSGYIEGILRVLDGVLVAGGDDADPALFGEEPHRKLGFVDDLKGRFEAALMRAALEARLPLFGICGGVQMLNVVCGGTLHQDIASCTGSTLQHQTVTTEPRPSHSIELVPGTRLYDVLGQTHLRVNSTHHQAINALGDGLEATAHAPDGIIEALERPGDPFLLGVQFHPESLAAREPVFQRLFDAFVEACVPGRPTAHVGP